MADQNKDMRRERGEGTRRALLRAAISSVAQNGLAGTTLSAVAGIAGVSRALVGFHFESKDQLLVEALETSLATYDASLRAAMSRARPDALSQLGALLAHDVGFATSHAELLSLWCAVWGEARGIDHYRVSVLPTDRKYREEIAAYLAELLGDRNEAKRRASVIHAFIFGIWLDYHLDPEGFKAQRASQAATTLLKAMTAPLAPG